MVYVNNALGLKFQKIMCVLTRQMYISRTRYLSGLNLMELEVMRANKDTHLELTVHVTCVIRVLRLSTRHKVVSTRYRSANQLDILLIGVKEPMPNINVVLGLQMKAL